jgi:exodeoxyribonuclease VII small subunit
MANQSTTPNPAPEPGTDAVTEPAADSNELADLGYEQARDELMEVVRRLETGGLTLEESLAAWERGEALAKHCQKKLDGARARLDAAVAGSEGE